MFRYVARETQQTAEETGEKAEGPRAAESGSIGYITSSGFLLGLEGIVGTEETGGTTPPEEGKRGAISGEISENGDATGTGGFARNSTGVADINFLSTFSDTTKGVVAMNAYIMSVATTRKQKLLAIISELKFSLIQFFFSC